MKGDLRELNFSYLLVTRICRHCSGLPLPEESFSKNFNFDCFPHTHVLEISAHLVVGRAYFNSHFKKFWRLKGHPTELRLPWGPEPKFAKEKFCIAATNFFVDSLTWKNRKNFHPVRSSLYIWRGNRCLRLYFWDDLQWFWMGFETKKQCWETPLEVARNQNFFGNRVGIWLLLSSIFFS